MEGTLRRGRASARCRSSAGEEVLVTIDEPHMYNVDDAVAKIDGYIVSVTGGGAYLGQKRLVRIEDAGRNSARATLVGEEGANPPPAARKPAAKRSSSSTRRKPAKKADPDAADAVTEAAEAAADAPETPADGDALESKPRRRGRRGGRRRSAATADAAAAADSTSD